MWAGAVPLGAQPQPAIHLQGGVPGSAKKSILPLPPSAAPSSRGTSKKVVGFPGFINTRPKCIVPSSDSSVSFSKSFSPALGCAALVKSEGEKEQKETVPTCQGRPLSSVETRCERTHGDAAAGNDQVKLAGLAQRGRQCGFVVAHNAKVVRLEAVLTQRRNEHRAIAAHRGGGRG